jgi:hypothetical protein
MLYWLLYVFLSLHLRLAMFAADILPFFPTSITVY